MPDSNFVSGLQTYKFYYMKKTVLVSLFAAFLMLTFSCVNNGKPSVAVVIDSESYGKSTASVDNYVASMKLDGRNGLLIIADGMTPETIRDTLRFYYENANLEGAVFIGNIPVPMIRDAQHLTTAFKMDQNRDWKESSVPSDRYYDDFDLKFDFLKQDGDIPLYYYYSLRADSPQYIESDIYSGRIKPCGDQSLSDYLDKTVEWKKNRKKMNYVFHFAGHGYNSESMTARIDESTALREHFPFLEDRVGARLEYIDYTFDDYVRYRLFSALSDPSMDIAILHHHGSEDTQYLNGSPITSEPKRWLELSRNFFRSKARDARDFNAAVRYYSENYDVPKHWISDAFDPVKAKEDSIHAASMDMTIKDMEGYVSGSKIVILDACFNGSFHTDDYIAAYHIFNPGSTVAVKANSVNTLQDTWTTELAGILNYGVSIGNWTKLQYTLESHVIGDPTFSFAPENNADISSDIFNKRDDVAFWKKMLGNEVDEIRALSIKMLWRAGAVSPEKLLEIQKTDKSRIVRLEAFMTIKRLAADNLPESIILALGDDYELTQRMAAITAAENGAPELADAVARIYSDPTTGSRVQFQLQSALAQFDPEIMKSAFENNRKYNKTWPLDNDYQRLLSRIEKNYEYNLEKFKGLAENNVPPKEKKFTIKAERNNTSVSALDYLFELISGSDDKDLRLIATETLGWYTHSCRREEILDFLDSIYPREKDTAVKNEILKSKNRLTTY